MSDAKKSAATTPAARFGDGRVQARIVGVDLSADHAKTDACVIEFGSSGVEFSLRPARGGAGKRVTSRIDDGCLRAWLEQSDGVPTVVGMDAPFGWPRAFVDAVSGWSTSAPAWPAWDQRHAAGESKWKQPGDYLGYRSTDRFVRVFRRAERQVTGARRWPEGFAVGADRIAVTAFRAARVMSGLPVCRTGECGPAIEVYPGGALAEWDLYESAESGKGYRTDPDAAGRLTDLMISGLRALGANTEKAEESLRPGGSVRRAMSRHHVFDAVVAAVATWAALVDASYPPPGCAGMHASGTIDFAAVELANRTRLGIGPIDAAAEGWIHHPAVRPNLILGLDPVPNIIERQLVAVGGSR